MPPGAPHLNVVIENVDLASEFLDAVIELHATRSSRLGLFPEGAFREHAARKSILAAVTDDKRLAGYLLFRVAKNRAAIVHLAIAPPFAGKGVARTLVDELKRETKHLLGISLKCRRDYNLGGLWSKLGFTPRHSKAGRGADGALLDYWWFDHNHDDLFSIASAQDETVIPVAIDANVFYDLTCESRPHAEDTRVLQADWLQDSISLRITAELYNEIHRAKDETEKKRARLAAQNLHELKTDNSKVETLKDELGQLFRKGTLSRDESDIKQLAHAIAGDVPFFATRDKPLLNYSDRVFDQYGLRIIHPVDLIVRFDALRREAEYRPASLEGSRWRARLVTADDVELISQALKDKREERSNEFQSLVRHYLAQSNSWTSRVILDETNAPAIYFVTSRGVDDRLEIVMLRHSEHPLIGTVLRHVLHELSRHPENSKRQTICVSEPRVTIEIKAALQDLGFLSEANDWWKFSVNGVLTTRLLAQEIADSTLPRELKSKLAAIGETLDVATISELERLFSPVKLKSPETPCFVISIRPSWAAHFFDIPVGGQLLMDLNERLHLGIEGAYYCSPNNRHLAAPGRILWYVSGTGSMKIKACSHLDEIMVGTAKELYGKLRHLGVYSWKHVFETAGSNLNQKLMAFRFSRTERFVRPVGRTLMTEFGIPQPQNPRRISDDQFAKVYRMGMGTN